MPNAEWSTEMAEMALDVMSSPIEDIGAAAITINNRDAAVMMLAALIRQVAELAANDLKGGA